jgi:hypothetical protein
MEKGTLPRGAGMSTYNSISWLPLAGGLTILGLILSWVAWRRRGFAAGLRGVAWSLLPLAAYLTGAIKMLWQMGAAIGDFASSFVFSPRVWAGVIVAGAAGVLFAVSGGLRRVRRGRSGGEPAQQKQVQQSSQPGQPSQPTKALKPASKPAGKKGSGGGDDALGDAAEVLRRMGIR